LYFIKEILLDRVQNPINMFSSVYAFFGRFYAFCVWVWSFYVNHDHRNYGKVVDFMKQVHLDHDGKPIVIKQPTSEALQPKTGLPAEDKQIGWMLIRLTYLMFGHCVQVDQEVFDAIDKGPTRSFCAFLHGKTLTEVFHFFTTNTMPRLPNLRNVLTKYIDPIMGKLSVEAQNFLKDSPFDLIGHAVEFSKNPELLERIIQAILGSGESELLVIELTRTDHTKTRGDWVRGEILIQYLVVYVNANGKCVRFPMNIYSTVQTSKVDVFTLTNSLGHPKNVSAGDPSKKVPMAGFFCTMWVRENTNPVLGTGYCIDAGEVKKHQHKHPEVPLFA